MQYELYMVALGNIRSRSMTVLASETIKRKSQKSKFNDEFENYLKNQCLKTTFNGIEVETFSWYKKVLGLVQQTKKGSNQGMKKGFLP